MTESRQPLLSEISRRRKLAILTHHLPVAASILEVGTGDGWFSGRLRLAGHNVKTIDLHPPADMVGDIKDWQELGLTAGTFDAIVALEVIEHVDCLTELRALCRPNGLIMLSSPHPKWDWVMVLLERLHLTQPRTSPHINLTDFSTIPLDSVVFQRPGYVHQVALFRNASL